MRRQKTNINSLPSNSKKRNRAVEIEGNVRLGKRKTGLFYHIRNIGNSLFDSVIWPAIQNLAYDFLSQGGRMLIFGEDDRRGSSRRSYNSRYDRRDRVYSNTRRVSGPTRVHRAMPGADIVEDIFFDHRESAAAVLDRLDEYIAQYGHATVGDLRAAVGFTATVTHQRYGWTSLRGTRILSTTDGYIIDFPEVEYLR